MQGGSCFDEFLLTCTSTEYGKGAEWVTMENPSDQGGSRGGIKEVHSAQSICETPRLAAQLDALKDGAWSAKYV
jgi:hypothetical protein